MTWKIEWDERARKELRRLGQGTQQKLLRYLRERIATALDPRRFGKQLSGEMSKLWRYRVGDFRIICAIEDNRLVVVVLRVAHRSTVYKKAASR